jgi:RND family efflux transporter MFP subunit
VKTAAPKPPVVIVAKPVMDYVSDYEDFTGRTDAVFSVEIRARVSGFLDKVHFKDGDEVKEGDLLFEIDSRPYKANFDRTEATLAQSRAHFERIDRDYRRVANLYSRGNASREEFDKASGDRSEAEAAVGVANADYDLAKLNMTFTRITSPISGRLSRRLVDPGNLVQADTTPMTTIVSLDPLYVYFDVDERTLLRLRRLAREKKIPSREDQEIPVLTALSDETSFPHKGVINFSDNRVDPGTGTLRVRASIANPKPRVLSPGLFMRVRLPVGAPRKSIMIAEKAIGTDQGQKYVYVVNDKNQAAKRLINVGKLDSGMREIVDGLGSGERVVVEGLQRVRPGLEVDPKGEDELKADPKKAAEKKVAAH